MLWGKKYWVSNSFPLAKSIYPGSTWCSWTYSFLVTSAKAQRTCYAIKQYWCKHRRPNLHTGQCGLNDLQIPAQWWSWHWSHLLLWTSFSCSILSRCSMNFLPHWRKMTKVFVLLVATYSLTSQSLPNIFPHWSQQCPVEKGASHYFGLGKQRGGAVMRSSWPFKAPKNLDLWILAFHPNVLSQPLFRGCHMFTLITLFDGNLGWTLLLLLGEELLPPPGIPPKSWGAWLLRWLDTALLLMDG